MNTNTNTYLIATVETEIGLETAVAFQDSQQINNEGFAGFLDLGEPGDGKIRNIACASNKLTGKLHSIGGTSDGLLFHNTWGDDFKNQYWDKVTSVELHTPSPAMPLPKLSGFLSCTFDINNDLHIFVIDDQGLIFHTMGTVDMKQNGDEKIIWQVFLLDVPGPHGVKIDTNSAISCAADQVGNLHLFVVAGNYLWHSLGDSSGNWQPWTREPGNETSHFSIAVANVSCAANQNNDLQACAITPDGKILYSLYDYNSGRFGKWRDMLEEYNISRPDCPFSSVGFRAISCSTDLTNSLYLYFITDKGNIMYTKRSVLFGIPVYTCIKDIKKLIAVPGIPLYIGVAHN